ncbi:MAG: ferritin family protein [Nanobdellota archaeon]
MELTEIMDAAIRAEEQARDMYLKARDLATTDSQKELLERLAHEEQGHKEKLESLEVSELGQPHDATIAEKLTLTPLNELAELKEILILAMQRENAERETYEMLADGCEGDTKELFRKLASEEHEHKELLKKEFALMFG